MALLRASATLACLAFCLAGVASLDAIAQVPSSLDDLRDRYPPSSIDSVTKADAAMAATATAKGQVDKDYRAQAKACLSKVLVNACLDGVRTVQRKRLADVNAIELEANRFKRKDKADRLDADRAKHEAERAAKAPADEAERARNRATYEGKQADAARAVESEARRADTARARKPVVKLAPPANASAEQREKNVASYEAHQQEAKDHQVELARRLAEKTADRKRRAEAKAAKDAKLNATAAAASPAPSSTAGPKP